MNALKQQKGKAFENLPKKALETFDTDEFLVSTKYDGNQIFIVKEGDDISFYTSDWKPFYIGLVADYLLTMTTGSYMIVAEFMHDCRGFLGDRPKSAILTTYRTNFAKSVVNNLAAERRAMIKVFDFMDISEGNLVTAIGYSTRLSHARMSLANVPYINVVDATIMNGKDATKYARGLVRRGWEGVMLHKPHEFYQPGKRVNYCIKLKYRKTADLHCIGIEEGEGKYAGLIGSLILKDSLSRLVRVGSGLSDRDRANSYDYYIDKVIEIEYEQIMDTYIQPTVIGERLDKTIEEID